MEPYEQRRPASKEPQHFGFLDALRGFASLAVIATHTAQNVSPGVFEPLADYGQYGVQLFYIVSAFSLCLSLEQRSSAHESAPYRNYMLRRFFRIAPLFWIAVVVFLLKPLVLPDATAPIDVHPPTWRLNSLHVLVTLLFINGWHHRTINFIVPGGWSVAVESNFYLLLPKLYAWTRTLTRAFVLVGASLVFGALCRPLLYHAFYDRVPVEQQTAFGIFSMMWLPSQLSVFALGLLMYQLVPRSSIGWRGWGARRWALPLATLIAGAAATRITSEDVLRLFPRFFLYGCALFGFAWLLAWMPVRLLVNRVTVFFGRISYSLYLFHFLFLHLVLWLIPGARQLPYILVLLLVTVPTIGIATITHRFIERGGQALGKRLIARLESRARGRIPAQV